MKFALSVVALSLGLSAPSFACSTLPLEMRIDFFNDVATQVLSGANVQLSEVKLTSTTYANTKVIKYEWIQSDPRFMCHDKETFKTDVEMTYEKNGGRTGCVVSATVTKTESYYKDAPKTVYDIQNLKNACE
jgi:hypothetical protein